MFGSRKWSMKYKKSINCRRPKGFSQRQHCKRKKLGQSKYGRGRIEHKTRKNRKTRKQKRQKGGNPETERIIKGIFTEDIYDIVFNSEKNSCEIYNKGHRGDETNLCVVFTIKGTDYIYIDILSKCIASGTKTLENMDRLAKELGISKLQLYDGSSIHECEVGVNLYKLNILTTGESWYNKMGYKSPEYVAEQEINNQILGRNAMEFVNECLETERERRKMKDPTIRLKKIISNLNSNIETEVDETERKRIRERIIEVQKQIDEFDVNERNERNKKIDDEMDGVQDLFNNGVLFPIDGERDTVQQYFTNMKHGLFSTRTSVDSNKCDMYRFASKLIGMIGNKCGIKYTNGLIKTVTP